MFDNIGEHATREQALTISEGDHRNEPEEVTVHMHRRTASTESATLVACNEGCTTYKNGDVSE